jgi:hypothetical protein
MQGVKNETEFDEIEEIEHSKDKGGHRDEKAIF